MHLEKNQDAKLHTHSVQNDMTRLQRTSKERSLKWVRGVDDGTRDIILYLLNSNAIAILVSDGYIHLYRNGY